MRIVFAGTPEVALPTLDALAASNHQLVGVVTRPDAPQGRGKKLTASPVAQRAEELGIPVFKPEKAGDEEFLDQLLSLDVDVCPVVAYGNLLPQQTLDVPKHGWINLHFSLLPRWRGAAPVQHALMAGDDTTGASVFEIVKELDSGPIYRTLTRQIHSSDTAGDLLAELAHEGASLVLDAISDIEQGIAPVPQPTEGITWAPKIEVSDAEIDWEKPAAEIDRLVRATNPEPGAWTTLNGERFKVFGVDPRSELNIPNKPEEPLSPGELLVTKRQVFVGTGDGLLELLDVQAFSKRRMKAIDWARGAQPAPGTTFTWDR